jgi:hypothetical protein
MAKSNAHRWGQIVGDAFELFVRDLLTEVASNNGVYLDFKKARKSRLGKKKVTWKDHEGNSHDLDYVLERGGSEEHIGIPIAFIESVWRRYTKHSKNKAQEVEAAVLPVARANARHQPLCGAVLAGEFTKNAINQLRSKGFAVLHIPYPSIVRAFGKLGVDAGSLDGKTTEKEFKDKIRRWESLDPAKATSTIINFLREQHKEEISGFIRSLDSSIARRVTRVRLTFWRGASCDFLDVSSAITRLSAAGLNPLDDEHASINKFEVEIKFNNGAKIEANFPTSEEAIGFLRPFEQ